MDLQKVHGYLSLTLPVVDITKIWQNNVTVEYWMTNFPYCLRILSACAPYHSSNYVCITVYRRAPQTLVTVDSHCGAVCGVWRCEWGTECEWVDVVLGGVHECMCVE